MIFNFWDIETLAKSTAELDAIMPPEIKNPQLPFELANPQVPALDSFVNKTMEKSVAKFGGVASPELEKAEQAYGDWRSGKLAEFHAEHKEKIAKWNADAEFDKKKFHDKAALSPMTGTVCLIGMRTVFSGAITAGKRKKKTPGDKVETVILCAELIPADLAKEFGVVCFANEKAMLAFYWDTLRDWVKHESGVLNIGWNSNHFDMPFVRLRSAVHGIKPSVPILTPTGYVAKPFWTDLMEEYACGDRTKYGKLNDAARLLGFPQKEQDGSQFGRLWATDKRGALSYLRDEDLRLTEAIGRALLSAI